MDDKQTIGKRKRGRPRKQRTEPPKVEDQATETTPEAETLDVKKHCEFGGDAVPVAKVVDDLADQVPSTPPVNEPEEQGPEYRTITLTIPVVDLSDGNEYQTSKNNPPKQIRTRPLTHEQGIALGSIRLGMIAAGLELEGGRQDFYSGGRRAVPVETKEQAIAKLLDMICEEVEKK